SSGPRTTVPPTSTTAGGGGGQCSNASQATFGPFSYPVIGNPKVYNTYVANNEWGANAGTVQNLCVVGPGSWTLAASAVPSSYTGVQTYPDIQQLTNDYCGNLTWNNCAN